MSMAISLAANTLHSSCGVRSCGARRAFEFYRFRGCSSRRIICQLVSWCSWLSRQSNTLKVSGSSPGGIKIQLFVPL
ncbi:hypothetical protein F5B18DRAFT_497702 [Nemania serpens]|nr:hypothetical protein F5B18DRAFT_497702 [Nemania serpens]